MSRTRRAARVAGARRERGEPIQVEIEGLTHDGRGVYRNDGKAVFVADALPGEIVLVQPLRRRKGQEEARLLEVVTAADNRVAPRCSYFGYCGGCALQHLEHASQLEDKQAQLLSALERIGGVLPLELLPPLAAASWAYRRRARLGVRWVRAKDRVLVGFRERNGSFIADMQHCEVLAEPCRELPGQLAELIGSLSIRTRLPQVEVTVADNAVALVFRVLDPPTPDDLEKLESFAANAGVRVYLQPGGLDSVALQAGDSEPLYYRLDQQRIRIAFEPTDFIQVNGFLNELMVQAAMDALQLEPGVDLLDLFCGLGNFSLPAARRGARVTGVEGEAALVERAGGNAAANELAAQFVLSNLFDPQLEDFPWARQTYDRVLLDPPRAGARAVVDYMPKLAPNRIVYVSCHPGTLARDTAALVQQGYELTAAGVMDMFPHTAHVESMAVFDRR